jgi:hypothetical protein
VVPAGQKIYEGSGVDHAWNGMHDDQLAPADVYVYMFLIRDAAGVEVVESKDVTLIR